MPQIKASTILGQFLIDDKPYQCGAYKPHYADGDIPKFGVKSNENEFIMVPTPVGEWTDKDDNPFTDLVSLITYIQDFFFAIPEAQTGLSVSALGKFNSRPAVSKYLLGQRDNYPTSAVLHDICEFTIIRPKNSNPDNYRIYTPETLTYDLEVLSTDVNDSNSVAIADAGVKTVTVDYLDVDWLHRSVDIHLDGTTPVAVATGVRRVNDMYAKESGEWGTARGNITLRTSSGSTIEAPWTGAQTLAYIAAGGNKDMTAIYTVPADKEVFVHALSVSSANQDQSIRLRANVSPNTRELVGINTFLFQSVAYIGSNANSLANLNNKKFPPKADIKISVLPNAGSADTSCHLEFTEMSI